MEMELSVLPGKWLKYEIMNHFQLRSILEVQSEIHRFPIDSYKDCLTEIWKDMQYSQDSVYVVKLVYKHRIYRLPNYLIHKPSDLDFCERNLATCTLSPFSEIWYCKNNRVGQLAFGRVLFSLDQFFPKMENILIEVVWGGSARLIEKSPAETIPYVSVTRNALSKDWCVQKLIPADREIDFIMDGVNRIVNKLPDYYRSIKEMGTWMRDCGCSYLALEFYSNQSDWIHFIDWDSDNDSIAISRWRDIRKEC